MVHALVGSRRVAGDLVQASSLFDADADDVVLNILAETPATVAACCGI